MMHWNGECMQIINQQNWLTIINIKLDTIMLTCVTRISTKQVFQLISKMGGLNVISKMRVGPEEIIIIIIIIMIITTSFSSCMKRKVKRLRNIRTLREKLEDYGELGIWK